MPNYLFKAFICTHCSIDTEDVLGGCQGTDEWLCLTNDCCLALNTEPYGVGMVTQSGDICRVGCYICTIGLKVPTTCCAGAGQFLCLKNASSLPFDSNFVSEPICAICFVKLYPTSDMGVLKEAPACNKISR